MTSVEATRGPARRFAEPKSSARRARQMLLWIHVLSSVSWMSQALALLVLMLNPGEGGVVAAHVLDTTVLVVSANLSAMSGFLLSSTTPWGFFVHWWVLVKFVITVGQLVVGIAVLSPTLDEATRSGDATPGLLTATVVMATLIAFQAWLSIAKPWPRVPRRTQGKAPVPGTVVRIAAPAALLGDVVVFVSVGQPIPLCSVVVLVAAIIGRRRAHRAGTSLS
ncbi:hypothetical protein [Gordonia sp. KTR9]|uniref:hypothetical protein n=1 Tax=Gordonia sp. KTR9 TaxID=337191 RepID=UPI00030F8AAB|nr:hypothetical protein [Gordonia sp. KTR9]